MSEVGNKRLLRAFADALLMKDVKQFPSDLDVSDIKAVIDIGKILNVQPVSEFIFTMQGVLSTAATQNITCLILEQQVPNGVLPLIQVGTFGQDSNGFTPDDYDYRIIACTAKLELDAAAIAANANTAFSWRWRFGGPQFTGGSAPYNVIGGCNIGAGKTLVAGEGNYDIPIYGSPSSANYPNTFPGFMPGRTGAFIHCEVTHRPDTNSPASAWNVGGNKNFTGHCWGIRYPKGYIW